MSFDDPLRALPAAALSLLLAGCGSDGDTAPLADQVVIADVNITAVVVTASKTTIAVAETFTLTASNGAGGADITGELRWTSDNPGVARVTAAGEIFGVAEGTATITASIGDFSDSESIVVSSASVQEVTIGGGATVDACDDIQLSATATFTDGRSETATDAANWDSSDETLADFDSDTLGLLHTFASGSVDVTAEFRGVTSAPQTIVVSETLSLVRVVASNTTVGLNASEQLTAEGDYSDGSTRDITANATWSSSADAVAEVNADGLLTTSTDSGNVVITASCNGQDGTLSFVIGTGDADVVNVEVTGPGDPPYQVQVNSSISLTATAEFADGGTLDVTGDADWTIDLGAENAQVGNESGTKGRVTGLQIGRATIRATYQGEDDAVLVEVIAPGLGPPPTAGR